MNRHPAPILCVYLSLLLVVAGCSWFAGDDEGTLSVSIEGLPAGVPGEVTVEGDAEVSYEVATEDERVLPVGSYTISIASVSHAEVAYYAAEATLTVVVEEDRTEQLMVDYAIAIPDSAVIVDPESSDAVSVIDENTLELSEVAEDVSVGGTVIAPDPSGSGGLLVRRVTEVDSSSGATRVTGEEIALSEAIPQGVIEFGALEEQEADYRIEPGYSGEGFRVVPAQSDDQDPIMEFGFGGFQVGADQNAIAEDKENNQPGATMQCALEVPPVKLSLYEYRVYPTGKLTWSNGEIDEFEVYLNFKGAAGVSWDGKLDAKCAIQQESLKHNVGWICKSGALRIVRIGLLASPSCDARVFSKVNAMIPTGAVKGETTLDLSFGVGVAGDADNPPNGDIYHNPSIGSAIEVEHKDLTLGVELAVEVKLGLKELGVFEQAIVIEQTIGIEANSTEVKIPFKGKVAYRNTIGWGDKAPFTENSLFQWNKDLYHLEEEESEEDIEVVEEFEPPPPPPIPNIPVDEDVVIWETGYLHSDVVDAAAERLMDHWFSSRDEPVSVRVSGSFGENFDAWLYSPDDVMASEDNALIFKSHCWQASSDCSPLILHFPPEHNLSAATDDPLGTPMYDASALGDFFIGDAWMIDGAGPTDYLPGANGTHFYLEPA